MLGAIAVIAAVAVCAPAAHAASAAGGDAQVSARKGRARQKAGRCTTGRRGARRGRGKARRSDAAAQASARGAKGRRGRRGAGGKRGKRCGRAAPKRGNGGGSQGGGGGERGGGRDRDRGRPESPSERRREREEEKGRRRPEPARPTAPVARIPEDGSYSAAAEPGMTLTIAGDGKSGRLLYTVPRGDFSEALCQTEDVAVSIPLEFSPSEGSRSGVIGAQQLPGGGTASVLGSVARDGSFGISLSTNRPYAPDPTATCAASTRLEGTLTRAAAAAASADGATAVARAAGPRPPRAKAENCRRFDGRAASACRARNAANKVVLKKLLDTRLIGTRADGAAVDWSFCRNGRMLLATTSDGSTGRSESDGWQVEDARVRQGGKWFDAIVTDDEGTFIAVAMRGGRWKVGIESFGEVTKLGSAERSNGRAACAAPAE
jgi:hypothetical protein